MHMVSFAHNPFPALLFLLLVLGEWDPFGLVWGQASVRLMYLHVSCYFTCAKQVPEREFSALSTGPASYCTEASALCTYTAMAEQCDQRYTPMHIELKVARVQLTLSHFCCWCTDG